MRGIRRYWFILLVCVSAHALAQSEQPYLCEIGLQGGIGYYSGDATPYIFMNPREAYGLHFRYKFTKRWAVQAKFSGQRITGKLSTPTTTATTWENRLYNFDIIGEFNFLRFGNGNEYDDRIKPYTPYIFLGLGGAMYKVDKLDAKGNVVKDAKGNVVRVNTGAAYIPFGIGFKWKFSKRCGLNIAWQHNIYFADNIEGVRELDDPNKLNGWNIMNMDLTGMLTVGLVVEFGQAKTPCRLCNE